MNDELFYMLPSIAFVSSFRSFDPIMTSIRFFSACLELNIVVKWRLSQWRTRMELSRT